MQNRGYQVIILYTLAQLLILLLFGYTPYPDSNGYIYLAKQCMVHGEPYPVASMLNSYPFLWNIGPVNAVVLSLKLFRSIVPLLIVYSLMKGMTLWFFWQICRHIFNHERMAFIALVLYVIYPANYGESTSVQSELPFMFFTMTALWLCINKKWFFAAGVMLAVANWFRPFSIVFLAALMVYYLFQWKRYAHLLAGYLLMIVVIGSLTYQRTGLFLYQAKTGWMALTDYSTHHAESSMAVRDRNDWNVAQKDSAWKSLFIDWLKEHPTEYVSQMPEKLVKTYVSDNVNMCAFIPKEKKRETMYDEISLPTLFASFPSYTAVQWLTIANLLVYLTLLLGSMLSLFFFKRKTHLLSLSIIVLGTLMLLLVGHGEARFHIPFMPFMMILSAITIDIFKNKYKVKRT